MGLTIYYRWKIKADANAARSLVRKLHARVSKLPFDQVTDVSEYNPPDGKYAFEQADWEGSPWRPGDMYVTRKRADGESESVCVPGLHVLCFMANLKGSETAMFGLASHPPVVVHREDVITHDDGGESWGETRHINAGDPIEFPTRLKGWYSWSAFCKTQYAANPKFGGAANFLRAHLAVFGAVDGAKELGLKTHIRDDGHYWRHRSEAKLLEELKNYDELIAGFTGRLGDVLGNASGRVVAPIKERPDFEHLEAKGADRLKKIGVKKKPGRKRKS